MDAFLRDFALIALGAITGPVIYRIAQMPRRCRLLLRHTARQWADHRVWFKRQDRKLARELAAVDEDMNARGLYNSGIRLQQRALVIERYLDSLEDQWRQMVRSIEDEGTFVGWPEKLWTKLLLSRGAADKQTAERAIVDSFEGLNDSLLQEQKEQVEKHRRLD